MKKSAVLENKMQRGKDENYVIDITSLSKLPLPDGANSIGGRGGGETGGAVVESKEDLACEQRISETDVISDRLSTDAFDCIRGMGSLQVFFGHFYNFFSKPTDSIPQEYGGGCAVLMFFVMSGFLMMTGYANKYPFKQLEAKSFYKARIVRMVPMVYLSIIICIPLTVIRNNFYQTLPSDYEYLHPAEKVVASESFGDIITRYVLSLLFQESWVPEGGRRGSVNPPLWSTASQMFCYFFFPYCVGPFHTVRNKFRVRGDIMMNYVIYLILWLALFSIAGFNYSIPHINPIGKLPLFIMGCVFASDALCNQRVVKNQEYIQKWSLYCNVLTVFISCYFFMQVMVSTTSSGLFITRLFGELALPSLYGLWLYSFTQAGDSFAYRLFCWKPFVFFGKISFCFYVLHWPVMDYYNYFRNGTDYLKCARYTFNIFCPNLVETWEVWPIFLIVVLLATVCHYFVEDPLRDYLTLKWIGKRRVDHFKNDLQMSSFLYKNKANHEHSYQVVPVNTTSAGVLAGETTQPDTPLDNGIVAG